MPDVYPRSIEPLIAIVLDGYAVALPLSLPSLGVSSLDLGRLSFKRLFLLVDAVTSAAIPRQAS